MTTLPTVLSVTILATLSLAVGLAMNTLKPYLELLPGLRPGDKLHDSTIRLCTLLLTILVAVGYAASHNTLNAGNAGDLIIQVLLQFNASLGIYHAYNPRAASGAPFTLPSDAPADWPAPTVPTSKAAPAPLVLDAARVAAVSAAAEQAATAAIASAKSASAPTSKAA